MRGVPNVRVWCLDDCLARGGCGGECNTTRRSAAAWASCGAIGWSVHLLRAPGAVLLRLPVR